MRRWFTLLFVPTWLGAQEIPPVKVRLEKSIAENGRNAWVTPQFRVDADAGIKQETVEKLAVIAESTISSLRAHPLPLAGSPAPSKPRITLFADAKAYGTAGGADGTAGFYLGWGEPRVLIRADYFMNTLVVVEKGRLAPGMDEDLVVHELVHLGMHGKSLGMPQWFAEGTSEYFACAHRGGGRFSFSGMDAAVRDHLRKKLSPKDPAIRLLPVASIAGLDGEGWLALMKSLPAEERFLAYGTALLLAHYHLNGGPERLEKVRTMLEKADRARRPVPFLTPKEGPEIEKALIRFWKDKGIDLRFANAAGD